MSEAKTISDLRSEGIKLAEAAIRGSNYGSGQNWAHTAATAAFDAALAFLGECGPRSELLRSAFLSGMDKICNEPA